MGEIAGSKETVVFEKHIDAIESCIANELTHGLKTSKTQLEQLCFAFENETLATSTSIVHGQL
jgi:hypothetical protein